MKKFLSFIFVACAATSSILAMNQRSDGPNPSRFNAGSTRAHNGCEEGFIEVSPRSLFIQQLEFIVEKKSDNLRQLLVDARNATDGAAMSRIALRFEDIVKDNPLGADIDVRIAGVLAKLLVRFESNPELSGIKFSDLNGIMTTLLDAFNNFKQEGFSIHGLASIIEKIEMYKELCKEPVSREAKMQLVSHNVIKDVVFACIAIQLIKKHSGSFMHIELSDSTDEAFSACRTLTRGIVLLSVGIYFFYNYCLSRCEHTTA